MEHIEFEYPNAQRRITNRAHVGVVGSGDMEVLFEQIVRPTFAIGFSGSGIPKKGISWGFLAQIFVTQSATGKTN
jgi:hypothetical protein